MTNVLYKNSSMSGPAMVETIKEWIALDPQNRKITTDVLEMHDASYSLPNYLTIVYTLMADDIIIAQCAYRSHHGVGLEWDHVKAKTTKGEAVYDLILGIQSYNNAPVSLHAAWI